MSWTGAWAGWQGFWQARALFADAMLAAAAAGALLGLLGVYVVLRRMVFVSAALCQAAGCGVVVGFYVHAWLGNAVLRHVPAEAVAMAFALAAAGGAAAVVARRTWATHASHDGVLGAIYLVSTATGLALATRIPQELHDAQSMLMGSAVAVLPTQAWALVALAMCLCPLHLWWHRGIVEAVFDAEVVGLQGLPVRALQAFLMGGLAVAIALGTRALGALPVFAFSVLPAMAAVQVAPCVGAALWLAAGVGSACGVVGYVLAYAVAVPVGTAQALVSAACVAGAAAIQAGRAAWTRRTAPAAADGRGTGGASAPPMSNDQLGS